MNAEIMLKKLSWIDNVAGFVWVFLTILMVLAIFTLSKSEGQIWQNYSYHVLALIVLVWLYPVYTFGFQLLPGFIGNIVVLIIALYVIFIIANSSILAAGLIIPTVIWLGAATYYTSLMLIQSAH